MMFNSSLINNLTLSDITPDFDSIITLSSGIKFKPDFPCYFYAQNQRDANGNLTIGSRNITLNGAYGSSTGISAYLDKGTEISISGTFQQLWYCKLKGA